MSLYHNPKGYHQQDPSHRRDACGNTPVFDEHQQMMAMMMQRTIDIPSVIVVPRRPCRVTSTMAQHYRDMPGAGAEISPSSSFGGGGDYGGGTKSNKPWQVDMAKKTYTSSASNRRRFNRKNKKSSNRHRRAEGTTGLPPATPPVSSVVFDAASPAAGVGVGAMIHPEMDGSWNNVNDDYPSDEENGFGGGGGGGGGMSSRGSSPASSTHTGSGSAFGSIVLKGYYGGRSGRRV